MKRVLTEENISIEKRPIMGKTPDSYVFEIKDSYDKTSVTVFGHEARFIVKALTVFLSESSNPPSDEL
jgi:hypothetical protein